MREQKNVTHILNENAEKVSIVKEIADMILKFAEKEIEQIMENPVIPDTDRNPVSTNVFANMYAVRIAAKILNRVERKLGYKETVV